MKTILFLFFLDDFFYFFEEFFEKNVIFKLCDKKRFFELKMFLKVEEVEELK